MLTGYQREVLMHTTLINLLYLRIRLRSQLTREWQWSQNRSCSISHSFASGLVAFSCALPFPGRKQHVGCALPFFSNWALGLHLLICSFCFLLQVSLNFGKQWLYWRHRKKSHWWWEWRSWRLLTFCLLLYSPSARPLCQQTEAFAASEVLPSDTMLWWNDSVSVMNLNMAEL